jgi:hypothetical protein
MEALVDKYLTNIIWDFIIIADVILIGVLLF